MPMLCKPQQENQVQLAFSMAVPFNGTEFLDIDTYCFKVQFLPIFGGVKAAYILVERLHKSDAIWVQFSSRRVIILFARDKEPSEMAGHLSPHRWKKGRIYMVTGIQRLCAN